MIGEYAWISDNGGEDEPGDWGGECDIDISRYQSLQEIFSSRLPSFKFSLHLEKTVCNGDERPGNEEREAGVSRTRPKTKNSILAIELTDDLGGDVEDRRRKVDHDVQRLQRVQPDARKIQRRGAGERGEGCRGAAAAR